MNGCRAGVQQAPPHYRAKSRESFGDVCPYLSEFVLATMTYLCRLRVPTKVRLACPIADHVLLIARFMPCQRPRRMGKMETASDLPA